MLITFKSWPEHNDLGRQEDGGDFHGPRGLEIRFKYLI